VKVGDTFTITGAYVVNPLADWYYVVIRRESDGVVRKVRQDEPFWDDATVSGQDSAFYWTDGNGACDCSMAISFADAGGEARPEYTPCGESAYTLIGFELPDGTLRTP
jgi:hypothetical protein